MAQAPALPPLAASLGLHALVLGLLLAFEGAGAPAPLIDPREVVEVAMVPLPAAADPVPPPPPEPAPPREDAAPPEALPEPAPADAAPAEPEPDRRPPRPRHEAERRRLLAEMRRKALVEEVAANAGSGAVPGAANAARVDPVLGAYVARVRAALLPHFHPIQDDPRLVALVRVALAPDGRILDQSLQASSGNPSFDAAALRAVMRAARVPPPPPELRDRVRGGLMVRFTPRSEP